MNKLIKDLDLAAKILVGNVIVYVALVTLAIFSLYRSI